MRALMPVPAEDVDPLGAFGSDWLGVGGIRGVMLASVDGAATATGKSAGLQTPGDNRVFAALRQLADVVLVGSGTAEVEQYGPVEYLPPTVAARRAHGLVDQLEIAVLSRSLRLDPAGPLFADPSRRPLVVTVAAADAGLRRRLASVADVLICGEDDVDFARVRAELAGRGLRHVACEGGPTVLSAVAAHGQLDELCLSVTPFLAGPGAARIVAGPPWDGDLRGVELTMVLEEEGALFLRYRVDSAST